MAVKANKKYRICGLSVLLILSLVVSVNVFWGLRRTGLTLAGNAACGYEEHTHSEECFEKILVCELSDEVQKTEGYDESTLNCDNTDESHIHSEECYEKQYLCMKEEHVHSFDCYSDENADVETQLDWQEMFAGYITGNLRTDLVSVAKSQIGYMESERNFEVDKEGVRRGYTRYGAWYGAPYSDWSAMFVSFCLHYAGSDSTDTPYNIGANAMLQLWNDVGRFAVANEYSPDCGDLIFFADNTVGIISSVSFDVLTVVQGDVEDTVSEQIIMEYDESIIGYGILEMPELLGVAYTTDERSSSDFVFEACNCGNESAAAGSHADICAYKTQLRTIAGDYTADELYAIWNRLSSDAQEYILQYLTDNSWQYGTKAEDLKALIDGGDSSTGAEVSCGDATFRIEGALPETAELKVVDPGYSEGIKLSYINPNIKNNVNWSVVYDITIMDNGSAYTPDSPVTVTVELPSLVFNPDQEFFAVAHLNEVTGEMISREYVEVINNTVNFTATSFSPYMFYTVDKEVEGGERILDTNWIALRDSGFFTYWQQFLPNSANPTVMKSSALGLTNESDPSDVQVDVWGGESTNNDGVIVSKTIDGTDLENVFDITLTVQTQQSISEIYEEPDMAVVIVMDISQTMNSNFGGVTRYAAAMTAAENFLDQFAAQTGEVSRIGYVAFNTDAHQIFGLSACSSTDEAIALKNTMRQETGAIINDSGYAESHTRFTNIEAGLKMGADMLAAAPNENKYLIFLSDGFPTTYISSGYSGYDPYTDSGTPGTDGVFYDYVRECHCDYGTSYSDKAALRARITAEQIKESGVKIFSIGVDVGGQTISGHERDDNDFSVIDRTSEIYEIGDATSTSSYVNWLQNSIGSGYYYDSTNADGLQDAYNQIFEEILRLKEESSEADWVAQDPIPLAPPEYLEFIGFYDLSGTLVSTDRNLSGLSGQGQENTAVFDYNSSTNLNTITWDLKRSGYDKTVTDGVTIYSYQLVYRVRLKNELESFVENQVYDTNAPTSLTYRVFESENGVTTLSEQRTLPFKIPAVHGYLAELSFTKKDSYGNVLAGAEFLLCHDATACPICRGDGVNPVNVPDHTAISAVDGKVSFTGIPSGHTYTLQETNAPPGYISDSKKYTVVVAYDVLTMEDGWIGEVINKTGPEFPSTGGSGTLHYILTGIFLMAVPVVCGYIRWRKRERRSVV